MPKPPAPSRPSPGTVRRGAAAFPGQRAPVERRSAPARPGSAGELDGLGELVALVKDGFAGLPRTLDSPRRTAIWCLWLLGIAGDAWTTGFMLRDDRFEEGNPGAAVGMDALGAAGYTVVASVVCLLMAVVSTGRPAGRYARALVWFLLLVAVGKVAMTVHNLVLWHTV
jgi:hypothetical protein